MGTAVTGRDDGLRARLGRTRNGGPGAGNPRTFAVEVMSAATEARRTGRSVGKSAGNSGRSTVFRDRRAALALSQFLPGRQGIVMNRIFRHHGSDYRSAPLPRQVSWAKLSLTMPPNRPAGARGPIATLGAPLSRLRGPRRSDSRCRAVITRNALAAG